MDVKQEIEQLRAALNEAGYEYYVLDRPTMSDYDYDHRLRRLEELEKAYPEDITPDSLKNVTYEMLANELSKRMFDITHVEVLKLKTDAEYEEKLNALRKVVETVQSIVLDEIDGN